MFTTIMFLFRTKTIIVIFYGMFLIDFTVIGGTGGNRKEDFKPRITEHPQSVIVQRGEPTTLMCRAVGQPEPMITVSVIVQRRVPDHSYG